LAYCLYRMVVLTAKSHKVLHKVTKVLQLNFAKLSLYLGSFAVNLPNIV
jgi:hypothetical protein